MPGRERGLGYDQEPDDRGRQPRSLEAAPEIVLWQGQLIYIDPPYNTGNDFVYPDNFQDNIKNYLELTGQVDGSGNKLFSNTEASGRFHTDWLNMMYPRLKLARNLLQKDGVIFVSIADHEIHNLRAAMDEVFGSENFIATIIWHKMDSPKNTAIAFQRRPRLYPRLRKRSRVLEAQWVEAH